MHAFEKSIRLTGQPNSLGSPEVVSALIKELFDTTIRTMFDEATDKDIDDAVEKVVLAFTDDNAGYHRIRGWHSAEKMGHSIKRYLIGSNKGKKLAAIIGYGMNATTARLKKMLRSFMQDPAANWEKQGIFQINALHQFVVSVMLGSNRVLSGEKTLSDFYWKSINANFGNKQVILEVGAEGGSITLCGIQSATGWRFRVETSEMRYQFDDDEDDFPTKYIPITPERPWVGRWRNALKQLDKYPWYYLYPLEVHPVFFDLIISGLQARKKKNPEINIDSWISDINAGKQKF